MIGRVVSSIWSATEERYCAMGYFKHPDGESTTAAWLDAATKEVNIGGRMVSVSSPIRSWYRPKSQRSHLADRGFSSSLSNGICFETSAQLRLGQ